MSQVDDKDSTGLEKSRILAHPGLVFVPLVLVIGVIIGIALYFGESMSFPDMMNPFPQFQSPGFREYEELHIVLSTVSISLLFALIVVYAKTYLETKANFSLGLLVVLFALMVQAVLTLPLLVYFESPREFSPSIFSPFADVFTIVAYSIFLYLSLE